MYENERKRKKTDENVKNRRICMKNGKSVKKRKKIIKKRKKEKNE